MPSEAVLFRKIESDRPTLLLDEVDGIFRSNGKDDRKEALRSLLNAGFEEKAQVPRCVGQGTNQEVKNFAVFCAKALAGIGKLPDTVRDRAVPVQLVRRAREEKVERFRKRDAEREASVIRSELEAWSKTPCIIESLREARPTLPDALSDRQQDICEPLLAIADMAGGDWPERTRRALVTLCSESDEGESLGVKLLSDIREVFNGIESDRIATQDLLTALVDLETDSPWAIWWEADLKNGNTRGPAQKLARLLKPYKIVARGIRMPDGSTPRGYRREDFLEAWKRYLPANALNNATFGRTSPMKTALICPFRNNATVASLLHPRFWRFCLVKNAKCCIVASFSTKEKNAEASDSFPTRGTASRKVGRDSSRPTRLRIGLGEGKARST